MNFLKDSGKNLYQRGFWENFRVRRWGSSLPGLRTRDPPLSRHQRKWKFSGARVCRVTLKHLPKPIVASSVNLWGTS